MLTLTDLLWLGTLCTCEKVAGVSGTFRLGEERGVQRRAGRHVLRRARLLHPLRPGARLLAVQAPETVVILVAVALLPAAPPPGLPEALRPLVLDLGAVQDVDGVGRQRELQAVQVLVHHLFAVDELAAVDLWRLKDVRMGENTALANLTAVFQQVCGPAFSANCYSSVIFLP